MTKLSLLTRLGNAYAVLLGKHGAVSLQARHADCSRQSVYNHAVQVQQSLVDSQLPGPSRQQLLADNGRLAEENRQLWAWLEQAVDGPVCQQQQFTVTATAMGLSLTQILSLLAILLPKHRLYSRASLGRQVQQSAGRARRLLHRLDQACQHLVLILCLDEIFLHARPVLMGVEPHSMAWMIAARTSDRGGETWAQTLSAWPHVADVAADGGTGIARGLELAAATRHQGAEPTAAPVKAFRVRLDPFHILRDGTRALRVEWGYAQTLWEEAEKVERAKGRFARSGQDQRHFSKGVVAKAWAKAEAAFERACRKERAWQRAAAAVAVLRPDGRLNERAWAEGELQAATAELTGPHWAKVCRQLQDKRALTFLDRLHEELAVAEPNPHRRAGLVALWRWQTGRSAHTPDEQNRRRVVREGLKRVLGREMGEQWPKAYGRVRRVLEGVVRASSAVECVNSVVRMHQARHRNLSQELLDLKRLYWNCRLFREGKRKESSPYKLLGLELPSYDPWTLLQMDPEILGKQLSNAGFTV